MYSTDIMMVAEVAVKPTPTKVKVLVKRRVLKPLPVVVEEVVSKSIWMTMRRPAKKLLGEPIFWPTEDITDDEGNDEEEQSRRARFVEKFRENSRRIAYEDQLYDLQYAGLFLKW